MIVATLLNAIASILHIVIAVYIWIIIIAAVCSLVQANPHNKIVQVLYAITEPAFELIRRVVPTVFGGIDLSPFILLIILKFIDLFFVRVLFNYAQSL